MARKKVAKKSTARKRKTLDSDEEIEATSTANKKARPAS